MTMLILLQTEYLKQQDEIKALIKENDHLKMILPANDQQTNHLVKENLQLKDEIEKLKVCWCRILVFNILKVYHYIVHLTSVEKKLFLNLFFFITSSSYFTTTN